MASSAASFRERFPLRVPMLVMIGTALIGCASLDDVRPVNGRTPQGVTVTYEFPYNVVFQTTKAAAEELRLAIKEENPDGRYFLADDSLAYTKYGEVVGVYFERVSDNATKVTVATKVPVFPLMKFVRQDYTNGIHRRLREKLDLR
jgi:small-conductance mechanosensitive channel